MSEYKMEVSPNWDIVELMCNYFGLDRADFALFNTREKNRYVRIICEDLDFDTTGVV